MEGQYLFFTSNGYDFLESYTEKLYGDRGTFHHNLQRYLRSDIFHMGCRMPQSMEDMLVNAQDKEEQAAIWIAATAKELSGGKYGTSIWRYADLLETAAWEFLGTRYYLWHHAMKRLVPDIMIPRAVLENITCEDVKPVIGLIQMNTILLKSTWSVLRYTSLKDGDFPESDLRKNGKDIL